jgi:hypothetical protein
VTGAEEERIIGQIFIFQKKGRNEGALELSSFQSHKNSLDGTRIHLQKKRQQPFFSRKQIDQTIGEKKIRNSVGGRNWIY